MTHVVCQCTVNVFLVRGRRKRTRSKLRRGAITGFSATGLHCECRGLLPAQPLHPPFFFFFLPPACEHAHGSRFEISPCGAGSHFPQSTFPISQSFLIKTAHCGAGNLVLSPLRTKADCLMSFPAFSAHVKYHVTSTRRYTKIGTKAFVTLPGLALSGGSSQD